MKKIVIMAAAASIMLFAGCKKEQAGTSTMTVKMKDAPAIYDNVFVEVTGVEVNTTANGWVSIPVKDTIYDLLELQGGNTVTLGTANIVAGNVTQVRLILGTQNSIVLAGISIQLQLSSQDETGLKINVNKTIAANTNYNLLIDFDANQSIVAEGSGSYRLKPTLTAAF